ncbi:hypothetical protein Pcinc_034558 [Petrolisthes cinctipes]|uniref:Uncharacterized protein n=1 Tax=Petrolisthes cinctipes TaxID=88211 RepID=A0AAE1EPS7_PETCI|nr:hypothetical protein Pcinc_034558 [Petrolisthes cinctipes]
MPPAHPSYPPYTTYDSFLLSYRLRYPTMAPAPSWTATPLLTRDGKALPPPPPGFVRDSVPMPVPPT